MLLQDWLQGALRLPFGKNIRKWFEAEETQISCVSNCLGNVVRPGYTGMAYFYIPFLAGECRQHGVCRAQSTQLYQATTTYRLFQKATQFGQPHSASGA